MKLLELLNLKEFSDKVIKLKIEEWTKETKGTVTEEVMRAAIDNFDRIKSNIVKRIQAKTLTLSPKFMPPDPDKKLRMGEKPLRQENPQDIMKYTWKDMEILFDSYGTKAEKSSKDFYTVQDAHLLDITGVSKIYSGNGLYVYEGSNKEACIRLNYAYKYKGTNGENKYYNFCIGDKNPGINRYFRYRFGGESGQGALYRTFYYVADSEQSAETWNDPEAKKPQFKNWYHFFVIHVFENGKFGVTDAVNEYGTGHENDGNKQGISWDEVGKHMIKYGKESGIKAWNKIKDLKNLFVYIAPPESEEIENIASNGRFNLNSFAKASNEVKNAYIQKRASDVGFFDNGMFKICTKEQKQLAINSGFKPSMDDLKNSDGEVIKSLAKRYADRKFKINLVSYEKNNDIKEVNDLLPLPFIQFLDEFYKLKYFELFEKKDITFEYALKYFGEDAAAKYVNNMVKTFSYIPKYASKYIEDEKTKVLYNIIYKLYSNWDYNLVKNLSEKELEKVTNMPEARITPVPITYQLWKDLPSQERKIIISFIKKYGDKNDASYIFIKYAMPFLITLPEGDFVLIPLALSGDDGGYYKWVLSDDNGNIFKYINGEETKINGDNIISGYPSNVEEDSRILNPSKVEFSFINRNKINEIKYSLSNFKDILN